MRARVRWRDETARRRSDEGGRAGLRAASEVVLERASELAPYESGRLVDSGVVSVGGEHATVSYDTVYAARLHAHPEYEFQRGRRSDWLEQALDEADKSALAAMAVELAKRLMRP